MSPRGRAIAARSLLVAAALVLVLALLAGYARRAFVDADQFANRAAAALEDDSVRELIGERVTDEVILTNRSDLTTARPLIQSVVAGLVGGRAFTGIVRAGVRDAHRALFEGDQGTVVLTLADVGTVLAAALEVVRPTLASDLRATERVEVLRRDIGAAATTLAGVAQRVRLLAVLLLLLAVALVLGAVALAPDRRRAIVELGAAIAASGVLLVVALAIARSLAVGRVDGADEQAAAAAVWDAFLGDLRTAAWVLAASGAVVAAAAASVIRPLDAGAPLRRALERLAAEPARPTPRLLRGVVLAAAGVVVLVARDAVVTLVVTVAGVLLVFEGVGAILRVVQPAAEEDAERPRPLRQAAAAVLVRRRVIAGTVAAALVAGAVSVFVGTGGATTPPPAAGPCNGHEALCDRPLTGVAMAATHNAMSAPLPGWFASQQDASIADQLRDGVRGLLIDTHYAERLPNGRLRTEFSSREDLRRTAEEDGLSEEVIDSALRIRDRLGRQGEGVRGMYLCHTFCEMGGTPLADVLDDINTFLVANPGEVVVVINQDYVTPEDFVGAARRAGLADRALRAPDAGAWPTLGTMVQRDERIVFLAENEAGAAPWYRLAYRAITQETPFSFREPVLLTDPARREASCAPNRGPDGAPLFLVNHWITTDPLPLPSNAARVNAFGPLRARLDECRRLRRALPNLVAVDFYRRGDVFGVVDAINGVG
jgi:hypothetical protein